MGYRTDQFFKIGEMGEKKYGTTTMPAGGPDAGVTYYNPVGDNGNFLYPAREVRTADHSGYKTTQLRRGYMRSMRTQSDGIEIDVKKCGFQFNPSILQQSVAQADGLLNVFQSDPSQYAQPIPGNVSFSFELLFDRTMEVNNPASKNSGVFNPTNPWELSDPSEVGVLRDLATLFATIGQGVASYQTDYLTALLEKQFQREKSAENLDGGDVDEEEYTKKVAAIPDFLEMNVGNTAFLLPVPVRIVFSSLYIVEGFVQSTSVSLLKFSTQMVPMQCSVTVNVDAKYIGFAKPKTFLTVALDKEIEVISAKQQDQLDEGRLLAQAGSLSMGRVIMGIIDNRGGTYESANTLYKFLYDAPDRNIKTRFSMSAIDGVSQRSITQLFDTGDIVGGTANGSIKIYGPYDAKAANNNSQEGLAAFVTSNSDLESSRSSDGEGSKNTSAATPEEWENTAGVVSGPDVDKPSTLPPDTRTSSYYIVKYEASIRLVGGVIASTGKGVKWVLVPPNSTNYRLKEVVPIVWPTYGQTASGQVVTVPSDDSSDTRSTAPGRTAGVPASILQIEGNR